MKWNNIHKALPECNQKCLVRNRNLDEYEYNIAVFHLLVTGLLMVDMPI